MKRKSYLKELFDELMKRFPEYVTIEEASEITGVSKSKLKSDFKKEYKLSYYSYFRRERMKLAAHMLLETDRKISDIAIYVGYENSSKFSKAFCSVMGCSPSEYRRNTGMPVLFDTELADANSIGCSKTKEDSIYERCISWRK